MAQSYYSLEDAAHKLGMSVDELRQMANRNQIKALRAGATLHFPSQVIDELARQRGAGSEPELQLGEGLGKGPALTPAVRKGGYSLEDSGVDLSKPQPGGGPKSSKRQPRTPAPAPGAGDSDVRLIEDEPKLKIDSDVKLDSPRPRRGGDSGVRLVPPDGGSDSDVKLVEEGKPASDSDIRLQDLPQPTRKKGSQPNIITEEIDLDFEAAKAEKQAASRPPSRPATPASGPDLPILPKSSPYELSGPDIGLPPAKKGKPGQDSSSEHELIAFDAAKARGGDLGSGEIPILSDSGGDVMLGDLPPAGTGNSGINLNSPVDSGISLEGSGGELEFELSLDSGSTPKPEKKSDKSLGKMAADSSVDSSSEFELSLDDAPAESSDSEFELSLDEDAGSSPSDLLLEKAESSDSEFELTLDEEGGLGLEDGGGKDIFEDTNLDLPALDESGSEAVPLEDSDADLEDSSDFQLTMDDESGEQSGSQVVTLDDEEADDAAATVAKPRKTAGKLGGKSKLQADSGDMELSFDDDSDEDAPKPKAKTKPKKKAAVVEEEEDEEDEDLRPAAAAAPAEWGPLPAVLLFPTIVVMFFACLMGYELMQGMWGYNRSTKVGRPIIDGIARMLDDTIPKE